MAANTTEGPPAPQGARDRARHSRMAYLSGADGFRGVGLIVILLYHQNPSWAPGGYLSVSMFFTLSGFLITTLLLKEWREGSEIDLRAFWARRFRRLMPASTAALLFIAVYGVFAATPNQLADLRADILSALFYVANWHFILTDRSYADLFAAPSPVQHFWSLAIEEQFYFAFPLLTSAALALGRGAHRLFILALGVLTLGSTWLMALIWSPGNVDRAYYSTGARAAELLVGGLIAALLVNHTPIESLRLRQAVTWMGLVGVVVTLFMYASVPRTTPWIYHGGFLLFACITAMVIAGLAQREGIAHRILSFEPFRLLGVISYGVYLFHWPIYLWIDEEATGLDPIPLLAVRVTVSLTVAVASYHLLEMPIRERRWLKGRPALVSIPAAMALVVVVAMVVTANPPTDEMGLTGGSRSVASPPPPEPQPGVDRPVRVLVVGDGGATDLLTGLTAWSDGGDQLEVKDGTGGDCGPTMSTVRVDEHDIETCSAWIDAWTPMLDSYDPDVVLFTSAGWSTNELLLAGGRDPETLTDQGTDTWIRRRLTDAFDLLSSRGAEVVYLRFPHGQMEGFAANPVFFLLEFLDDAAVSAEHTRVFPETAAVPPYAQPWGSPVGLPDPPPEVRSWSDEVARTVGPVLVDVGMQNVRARGGPRVMIVGDSLAWSMGVGLQEWGLQSGMATVFNGGTYGCGVARGGLVTTAYGQLPPMTMCDGWAERWRTQVEDFAPDVIVLLTGLWDLTDRQIPAWSSTKAVGDPEYDEFVLDEYREAIEVLSVDPDAEVVWMMTPCYKELTYGVLSGTDAFDTGRLEYLNEVLVPELLDEEPGVAVIDPREKLCPGGTFVEDVGGIPGGRPDGIHLSSEASFWFAEWLGPQLVEFASGGS